MGVRTSVDDARVELHGHGVADDFTQKDGRVLAFGLGDCSVFHSGCVSVWAGCLVGVMSVR